jgi:hypothetical protein
MGAWTILSSTSTTSTAQAASTSWLLGSLSLAIQLTSVIILYDRWDAATKG